MPWAAGMRPSLRAAPHIGSGSCGSVRRRGWATEAGGEGQREKGRGGGGREAERGEGKRGPEAGRGARGLRDGFFAKVSRGGRLVKITAISNFSFFTLN